MEKKVFHCEKGGKRDREEWNKKTRCKKVFKELKKYERRKKNEKK